MSNSIVIQGSLGKDAVTRFSANGDPIVSFSVADSQGYGDKKTTVWWDVSLFGKRFEKLAPYLVKGAKVCVIGEAGTREYEGKIYLQVRGNDVWLVGSKGDTQHPQAAPAQRQASASAPQAGGFGDFDEEIPF